MKKTDIYLLQLISENDNNAFTELYDLYAQSINRFVYKRVKNIAITEDLTQEFWLYLWQNPLTFIPKEKEQPVKAYMFQYLRFRIFDLYRSSLPEALSIDNFVTNEKQEIWYTHVLELMEEKELYELIKEAIKEQPQIKKEVFHMRFGNYTVEEIADNLALSKRTVYNYYHESLTDVRKHLKTHHPELVNNFIQQHKKKILSLRSLFFSIFF